MLEGGLGRFEVVERSEVSLDAGLLLMDLVMLVVVLLSDCQSQSQCRCRKLWRGRARGTKLWSPRNVSGAGTTPCIFDTANMSPHMHYRRQCQSCMTDFISQSLS